MTAGGGNFIRGEVIRNKRSVRWTAAPIENAEAGLTYMYYLLPLTEDPRQVFTMDLTIDGDPFHARVEIRYLPAPDAWVISIWDDSSGDLLINQIPLICSYGEVNDLLRPFRHLRAGKGMGSLFVIRDTDEPSTPDPAKENLTEFNILWGRTIDDCQWQKSRRL